MSNLDKLAQNLIAGGSSSQARGTDALKDPIFLAKVRDYYRIYKGKEFSDDQEMLRHWRTDQTWVNWNVAGMGLDALSNLGAGKDELELKRELKRVYDETPITAEDVPTIGAAMLLDPTNLIGAGEAKAGVAALKGGAGLGKAALKAAGEGALKEGLIQGGVGAGAEAVNEMRDQELGLRDNISASEIAGAGLTQAGIGAGLGAVGAGAGTALFGKRALAKKIEAAQKLGFSDEDIAAMGMEELDSIISKGTQKIIDESPPETDGQAQDSAPEPTPTEAEAPAPTVGLDPTTIEVDRQRLAAIHADYLERLRKYEKDGQGADPAARQLADATATITALDRLPYRLQEAQESLTPLLDKNDLGQEKAVLEKVKRLNSLRNLYTTTLEDPSPERFAELQRKMSEVLETKGKKATVKDLAPPPATETVASTAPSSGEKIPRKARKRVKEQAQAAPAEGVETLEPAKPEDIAAAEAKPKRRGRRPAVDPKEFDEADVAKGDEIYTTLRDSIERQAKGSFEALRRSPQFEAAVRSLAGGQADEVWRYVSTIRHPISDFDSKMAGGLTREQRIRLREFQKIERAADPEADDATILARASAKAFGPPVDVSKSPKALPVNAGRNANGKVQDILRPGKWAGQGRTVTDGPAPRVSKRFRVDPAERASEPRLATDMEKAEQAARREANKVFTDLRSAKDYAHRRVSIPAGNGRIRFEENTAAVEYRAAKGEALMDGLPATRNERVWYDPVTRASYRKYESIRPGTTTEPPKKSLVERKREKLEANRSAAKEPGPDVHPSILEILKKIETGEIDLDGLRRQEAAAKEAATANREVAAKSADLPKVPARLESGEYLALRNREDPNNVRVLSAAQYENGGGLANLLGKNGDIGDWEIGHTTGKSDSKEAVAAFKAWDPATDATPAKAAPAGDRILSFDEANTPLNLDEQDADDLRVLAANIARLPSASGMGTTLRSYMNAIVGYLDRGELTPIGIQSMERAINSLKAWGNRESNKKVASALKDYYAWRERVMPGRVALTNSDVVEFEASLRNVGQHFQPGEVEEILKFVKKLADHGQGLPNLRSGDGYAYGYRGVKLSATVSTGPLDIIPNLPAMLHELGHWAYDALLTPEEKLRFWEAMDKYYKADGYADADAIGAKSPTDGLGYSPDEINGEPTSDDTKAKFKARVFNELQSPQELFANQFSMWAMQNRASVAFQDESFWRRVAVYAKALYQRYFTRDAIDQDLVPLFERLLPAREAKKVPVKPEKLEPHTPMGRLLARKLNTLRMDFTEFRRALADADDEVVMDNTVDLIDSMNSIHSLYAMKQTKLMRSDLMARMNEIVDGYVNGQLPASDGAQKVRNLMDGGEGGRWGINDIFEMTFDTAIKRFNALSDEPVIASINGDIISFREKPQVHAYRARMLRIMKTIRGSYESKMDASVEAASKLVAAPRSEKPKAAADIHASDAVPFKAASLARLQHEFDVWKDTDYGVQIAAEIAQRKKAQPLDASAPRLVVKEPTVTRAMRAEASDYVGLTDNDGVAPSARHSIREAQAHLTHRDGEKQSVMRGIFYRLTNLSGLADQTKPKIISSDFVANIAKVSPEKPGEVIDVRSPEFSALRSKLRRLANDLTDGEVDSDETVHSAIEMVVRSGAIPDDGLLKKAAPAGVDESAWFAEMVGAYLRNQEKPFGATPYALQLRALATKVQDAVGYVLNGHIGRTDIKARHPLIDNYGPMFGADDDFVPPTAGKVAAELVGANTRAAWENAGPQRRSAIKAFVGNGIGLKGGKPSPYFTRSLIDAADDDALVPVVQTPFGPGVRIHADAKDAEGASIFDDIDKRLEHIADVHGADSETYVEYAYLANDLQNSLISLQSERTYMDVLDARKGSLGAAYLAKAKDQRDLVRNLQDEVEALMIEMFGPGADKIGAYPVYVSMKNPLDLTGDLVSSNPFYRFYKYADENALLAPDADKVFAELADEDLSEWSGNDAYAFMVNLIHDGTGDWEQHSGVANAILKDMGYDGIIANAEGDDYILLFEPRQAKHINAATFDDSDFFNGYPTQPDTNVRLDSLNSAMLDQMDTRVSMEIQEIGGLPKDLSAAIGKMMNRRRLSARENKLIWSASLADRLGGTGSGRMRKGGLHYLADFIAPAYGTGHYERVASETARLIEPIASKLRQLPDVPRHLKAYANSVNPFSHSQPASHGRIVSALRRAPGSAAEEALSADERGIYQQVRQVLKEMVDELRSNGVMTGEIKKNYFPQVWNKDAILKDQDAFIRFMSNYMKREAVREGRSIDTASALEKAKTVFDNLVNDDGVFIPPPGSGSSDLIGNHVDYQRLIRLDQDAESLKELEPFLEDNLGAILTRYMDTATRKLDVVNKFGVGAHAWHDYMAVIEGGDEAIASLLSTNKVFRKDIVSMDEENKRTVMTLTRESEMPFANNPKAALEVVDQLRELIPHGPQAMVDYLTLLTDAADQTYIRRAEAIANAMIDRSKMEHLLHQDEITHSDQMLRAILRKPVDSNAPSNSLLGRSARALNNFNSVTLLSFTLLSSFGDVMLPLVRSGDMKAWRDGIAKMAVDPEYRQMMKNVGVSIENIVHENLVGLYGSTTSKFTTAFFNATGLTPWTVMMRDVSGAVGYEWFKAEFRKASKAFVEGVPLTEQPPEFRRAYRHLKQYGLQDLLANGQNIDSPDALTTIPELRQAMIKFSNGTIFEPNNNDIPVVWQTPVGRMLFQLKSFPLMMMRLTKHAFNEAGLGKDGVAKGERDYGPLLALLATAPAVNAGFMGVKDVVQARGEDNTHTIRERRASDQPILGDILKANGVDRDSPEADALLGWYMESISFMGGMGILGDMIHDTASNLDNGAYGAQRTASVVFGPSVGDFVSAFNVLAGVNQGVTNAITGEDKNDKVRQAWREVVGRVPVAGGIKSVREGTVDTLAGDAAS